MSSSHSCFSTINRDFLKSLVLSLTHSRTDWLALWLSGVSEASGLQSAGRFTVLHHVMSCWVFINLNKFGCSKSIRNL